MRTLILDEIHAVADDKRGSHLSLSVERLCALAEGPVTRIGLSATQRPIEEMARLLVGNRNIAPDGTPDCLIVDTGHARTIDLAIQLPEREIGPVATHEGCGARPWTPSPTWYAPTARPWSSSIPEDWWSGWRISFRRGWGKRLWLRITAVSPYHQAGGRRELKTGQVKVCVATASLELGIDVGVVDLVCQIGSPAFHRPAASAHRPLGPHPRWDSKGRLFPLTRDELVECTALARAIRRSNLDTLQVPAWPLDILAQQIVAACCTEEWGEDDLFDLCRRAYPYRELPREKFDQAVGVLSRGFAPRQGRSNALLHRDGVNRRLHARRGAGIVALTSGGAIPDNADYDVVADPEEIFVGTVNEDFAIESMAGDVFLLGNTPWKIRRVESGRVRVEDAQGMAPTIPFWLGEAPGRTWELSQEITELREAVGQHLDNPQKAEEWVMDGAGVSLDIAQQLVAYLIEGKRILGTVPTGRRVVAERFFDESGGMQLIIHAPFGAGINRAWGMALRKRICRTFDLELQASATDDGLNFSLGPSLSFPLSDVFAGLSPRNLEEVLTQAILQAPIFGTRWRWNASRALALPRQSGGRKVPPPLQRMRSDDLLAAVFPAQVACQDNTITNCHRAPGPSLGLRDLARLPDRGHGHGGPQGRPGQDRKRGDRDICQGHRPAFGLRPPDPDRHALRLFGQCTSGGAARKGGSP